MEGVYIHHYDIHFSHLHSLPECSTNNKEGNTSDNIEKAFGECAVIGSRAWLQRATSCVRHQVRVEMQVCLLQTEASPLGEIRLAKARIFQPSWPRRRNKGRCRLMTGRVHGPAFMGLGPKAESRLELLVEAASEGLKAASDPPESSARELLDESFLASGRPTVLLPAALGM